METPKSVAQAYDMDEKNRNILWEDVIAKEMKDVNPTFRKLNHW